MVSRWPQSLDAPPAPDGTPRRLVRIVHADQVETAHLLTALLSAALGAPRPHQSGDSSPLDFYLLLTPAAAGALRELAARARRWPPPAEETSTPADPGGDISNTLE
jgi:hypothetical protein